MAGLFKTGQQLRDERLADLAEFNAGIIKSQGGTAREQSNRQLGAMLGTALVGKIAGGDAKAAGDVAIPEGVDMQSPEGLLEYQRTLYDAGYTESATSLNKHIKDAITIKAGQDKAAAGTKKGKRPEVTAADRANVGGMVLSRAGNPDLADSKVATMLAPMYDPEEATPYQLAQAKTFDSAIAEAANKINFELEAMGAGGTSTAVVTDKLLDMIESRDDILNPETGFLFWSDDGFVDTQKLHSALANYGNDMVKTFERAKKAAADPKSRPVQVAPATQTTGQDDVVSDGAFDVQGSVTPDEPFTAERMPEVSFESEVEPLNQELRALYQEIDKAPRNSAQAKAMRDEAKELVKQIKDVRKRYNK